MIILLVTQLPVGLCCSGLYYVLQSSFDLLLKFIVLFVSSAPEKINDEITGFFHNAVCPFGLLTPIPVLLCASCLQLSPPFLWMGGGEVDVKLGLPVSDFIRATGALVADVSEPRQVSDKDED